MLVENAKLYLLKPTHVQKTTLRKNSLKFDKGLMLDMDMCAYQVLVLVLLAQPFTIELSTSHQEIDCNNCFGKHIHFLALCALVSLHCQRLASYLGSLPLGERRPSYKAIYSDHIVNTCMCINTITVIIIP